MEGPYSYGFPKITSESTKGIKLHRVDIKSDMNYNLTSIAVGCRSVLIAKDKTSLIRKIFHPEHDFHSIAFSSESEIANVFTNAYGTHSIITSSAKEAFYLSLRMDSVIPLPRLKGINISAVAFSLSPAEDTTEHFLIGTTSGTILAYKISLYGTSLIDSEPISVFDFPFRTPIYGLAFDHYYVELGLGKGIEKKTLVVVVTLNACYRFVGNMPFPVVFKDYWNLKKLSQARIELPKGDLTENELKLCYKVTTNGIFELESSAWKSDNSVCYRNFRPRGNRTESVLVPDIFFSAYQKKGGADAKIPKAIAINEFYIYMLYADNLTVVSRKNNNVEYSYDFAIGEDMKQMQYESYSRTLWLYSSKGIYQFNIQFQEKQSWQDMLDSFNYAGALNLTKQEKDLNYPVVAGIYANKQFLKGEYIEAAKMYSESCKIFEEVVLKFLSEEKAVKGLECTLFCLLTNHIGYLTIILEKLSKMKRPMITQKVLLTSWLADLKLRSTSEKEFTQFLTDNEANIDVGVLFKFLIDHGKETEALALASLKGKYETVVIHCILHEKVKEALEYLAELGDPRRKKELMLKYASVFLKHEPVETIRLFRSDFRSIPVEDLLPKLMSVQYSLMHKQMVINYLSEFAEERDCNIPSIHSLYLFTLASEDNVVFKDSLVRYLDKLEILHRNNQPVYLDKTFALNVCQKFGKIEALVKVYSMLDFYEKTVELALKVGDIELAKNYAQYAANKDSDKEMSKKLWLKIVEVRIPSDSPNMEATLKLLEESAGCLTINDVLQLSSPNIKIKAFEKNLRSQFGKIDEELDECRNKMNEFVETAERRRELISNAEKAAAIIDGSAACELCKENFLEGNKLVVFPCGHSFHRSCIFECILNNWVGTSEICGEIGPIMKRLQETLSLREYKGKLAPMHMKDVIRKVERMIDRGKAGKDLESYYKLLVKKSTKDCVLCGELPIEAIDLEFKDLDEPLGTQYRDI